MNLIIVESPTKARTLSRFLGKDYSIEATMGHIKDLPKSTLGVDIEKNFKPEYVEVEKRKETIESLKLKAESSKQIFLATDPDREGEAIAKHVAEVISTSSKSLPRRIALRSGLASRSGQAGKSKNLKLKRIVFHEITKGAVEGAIAHPRSVDKYLVDAQIARRVLDRLVGYKLSPLLWKKVRRGLSAGRVQTVAVRLIVEREREIEAFKPNEYWEIYCEVKSKKTKANNNFVVRLIKIADKDAKINNRKQADSVSSNLEKSKYKVLDVVRREVRKSPYPPFTTSTMTQAASRLFAWSAKKTMSTAQKLYEEGLITYHRTDSVNISEQAISKARGFIGKEFGNNYLPQNPRRYKTKSKVAQEAHEAVRPTSVTRVPTKLDISDGEGRHKKLYELIWRRFVACQMAESIYDETIIDVEAKGRHPERAGRAEGFGYYTLRASGQMMKFDGWRKVVPLAKDEEPELPSVEKDEPLQLIKVDSQQKFTQPPARFNEASLIKTLEKLGIGRPSTYAPTISTIQVRQYVEKDEGKFKPTLVGFAVNDYLIKNFPGVFNYQFTAGMEDNLDSVAKGELEWEKMMKEFYDPFEKKLVDAEKKSKRVKIPTEKLGKKCPTCALEGRTGDKQGELVIRVGRFGKFISCSRFPDCKHTEKYIEKIGMKCPECKEGDVIVKKTGKGRSFFGCSRFPDCKWASWKDPKLKYEGKMEAKSLSSSKS